MNHARIRIHGADIDVATLGEGGATTLYLHGFADLHGLFAEPAAFHHKLADRRVVVAPAHPGCGGSGGIERVDGIEDVVFHYLQVLDRLQLDRVSIVGTCFGGWIAAEFAVRHPERVEALALIASSGLLVDGAPTADLFMLSQPRDWGNLSDFRDLLFVNPSGELALELVPDGAASDERESLRYRALTFAARIGWRPPYFYNRKLRERLERISCPTLVVWGMDDKMIPTAHAFAFADRISHARLEVVADAGHAVQLEQPQACADLVTDLLSSATVPS